MDLGPAIGIVLAPILMIAIRAFAKRLGDRLPGGRVKRLLTRKLWS